MSNPLKIINEISAPDLTGENFSNSLNEAFEIINDNFKKIVSAPIYRGQQGESVKIVSTDVHDGENFTDEGQKIVAAIFDDVDLSDWNGGMGELNTILNNVDKYKGINGTQVTDYFTKNTNILVFMLDNVDGTILAPAQLYMFQDERIPNITTATAESVVDASCFVTFEYDGETYSYKKTDQFPTIAWSAEMGDFVWKINGQKTNILAKGLRGADASFYIPMFKVAESDEYSWSVGSIFNTETSSWATVDEDNTADVTIGMLCIAYITPTGDPTETPTGIEITTVKSKDDTTTTILLNRQGAAIEAKELDTLLNDVRPYDSVQIKKTNPGGIYIPASVDTDDPAVHALWRSTDTTDGMDANFGYVESTVDENEQDFNTTVDSPVKLNLHNYEQVNFLLNGTSYGYLQLDSDDNSLNIYGGSENAYNWYGKLCLNGTDAELSCAAYGGVSIELSAGLQSYINFTITNTDVMKLYTNSVNIYKPTTINDDVIILYGTDERFYADLENDAISLNTKTINLNTLKNVANTINVGNESWSTIYLKGKNVSIKSNQNEINNTNVTLNPTGTLTLKDSDYNYTDIISCNAYGSGDVNRIGYKLTYDGSSSFREGDFELIGWNKGESLRWRNDNYDNNTSTGWNYNMIYYQQYGRMCHIYGKICPPSGYDFYMMDLGKLSSFSNYKHPTAYDDNIKWVIGVMQDNNTDTTHNFKSGPVVWQGAVGGCSDGYYPVDAPSDKLHGWVYLSTVSDYIMFVTPAAGKYYWFDVWYLI